MLSTAMTQAQDPATIRAEDLLTVSLSHGSLTEGSRPIAQLSCVQECDDDKIRAVTCVAVGPAVRQVHNFPRVDWNCTSGSLAGMQRVILVRSMSCECLDFCRNNLLLQGSCSLTYQLQDMLVEDKNAVRILLSKWEVSENTALIMLAAAVVIIFCLCRCCSASTEDTVTHPVPKPGTSSFMNEPPPLQALKQPMFAASPASSTPSSPSRTAILVPTTVNMPVVPPRTKYPDGEHVRRWCFN